MRKIISLICFLLPAVAFAAEEMPRPDLRKDAPDRHVVVKGDTLWDISAKFFNDPWKWPHIWDMNKDAIKNPHLIYPGDLIVLDRINGTLHINGVHGSDTTGVVRLSPRIRVSDSEHGAIPSIPAKDILPFLSRPLVVDVGALKDAPVLIGTHEGRVMLSTSDIGFVTGVPEGMGNKLQVYRPGKTFTDPESKEVLGVEAVYLGDAELTNFADISTIEITLSLQEIYKGDRLITPSDEPNGAFLPRAPGIDVNARVISVYGGVSQAGQNAIIALNKGERDGLENGHVLALYHQGETVRNNGKSYILPNARYGMLFVFRVFDKMSYALVMHAKLPVQIQDRAQNP